MKCYNQFKNKNERERKKTHENLAVARRHNGVSLMPMRRITNVALTSVRRHSDAARPLRN